MRISSLSFVPLVLAAASAVHCGGSAAGGVPTLPDAGTDGGALDGGALDGGDPTNPDATGNKTSGKVDVLMVVDNSSSMSDKAALLGQSAAKLIEKLASTSDLHVGVVSSSLGSFGGDVCLASGRPDMDQRAHLQTTAPGGAQVAAAAATGFLSYSAGSDLAALVADTQALVNGVGQRGCGFEAQLETVYRFLSAPDPSISVRLDARNLAVHDGVDVELLKQRAAFLRPDSLVVVVMLTDEDDSSVDPLSLGGQGWAFMANQFPGSPVFRADGKTTTAPRATSTCASDPASPGCTSCGFAATCNPDDAACQKIRTDPECQTNGGYWGPNEDQLNVRFHRMRERFGIDPQFPLSRYVNALTKVKVPRIADEHLDESLAGGRQIGSYRADRASCTNPLFAARLPTRSGEELCDLPIGPRDKDLVVFALIGGVPATLVSAAGAPTSWDAVTGRDPAQFDFYGIDPHMIASTVPRPGLPPPSATRGDNGTDPIHGREFTTNGNDLQFACTFALPTPRTCAPSDPSCDCGGSSGNPPLCGATLGEQLRAKAYPTLRELSVARALGDRAVIGSICPIVPAAGYEETMSAIAARVASKLVK